MDMHETDVEVLCDNLKKIKEADDVDYEPYNLACTAKPNEVVEQPLSHFRDRLRLQRQKWYPKEQSIGSSLIPSMLCSPDFVVSSIPHH
jgi:hypothetical protein